MYETNCDKCFLDKEPCSKLIIYQLLNKEKLVNLCRTHEQIKLIKKNLVLCAGPYVHAIELLQTVQANTRRNFVQPFTRANTWASKATKELVKGNLVVCAGLNLQKIENLQIGIKFLHRRSFMHVIITQYMRRNVTTLVEAWLFRGSSVDTYMKRSSLQVIKWINLGLIS